MSRIRGRLDLVSTSVQHAGAHLSKDMQGTRRWIYYMPDALHARCKLRYLISLYLVLRHGAQGGGTGAGGAGG